MLLHDLLELDGHDVIEAADGLAALALAAEQDPDVVLLDVTMPGIDGFEVCRRLRMLPPTSATPVLLITALGQREHRLQGMSAGANDYLVKPIDRGEVSLGCATPCECAPCIGGSRRNSARCNASSGCATSWSR